LTVKAVAPGATAFLFSAPPKGFTAFHGISRHFPAFPTRETFSRPVLIIVPSIVDKVCSTKQILQ